MSGWLEVVMNFTLFTMMLLFGTTFLAMWIFLVRDIWRGFKNDRKRRLVNPER